MASGYRESPTLVVEGEGTFVCLECHDGNMQLRLQPWLLSFLDC